MKKLISVVMMICMCLCLVPTTVFAADASNVISKVSLTGFTWPKIGERPDFEMSVPEGAHYHFASYQELIDEGYESNIAEYAINGIWWSDSESEEEYMSKNDTYIGSNDSSINNQYYMQLVLIPDPGYEFADRMGINIEGTDEFILAGNSYKSYLYICTAGLFASEHEISYASTTFKVVNGTWDGVDSSDKSVAVSLMDGKGTLDYSKIPVGMKPAKGYEGGAWDVEPNTSRNGITGDVTYTYSFTKKADPISINAVDLTGFTAPVYGANPDFEMSVPEGAHYHFASTQELMDEEYEYDGIINGIWWNDSNGIMTEDDVFTNTSADNYSMRIVLIPDEGYEFAEDVNVTINGDSSTFDYSNSSRTNLYIETKDFTVTKPTESKASVTFKVVNGTWDGTDTADKSAEVSLTNGKGTLQESQIPVGMKPAKGYEGGAWDVEPNTSKDGITEDVTYTYSFTKKAELISINEVDMTGFTAPVYGANPDFEMSVPEGAHYHFASTQELKDVDYDSDAANLAINGIWWNNSNNMMGKDDVFTDTSTNAYYMDFVLIPDDGYEFAENVNIAIDGDTSLVVYSNSSRADIYILTKSFTVTEPKPESITYTLSFDKNGGTGTVPAPMTQTKTEESCEFTVPGQGDLVKENHLFVGWINEETNYIYEQGDKIELDKDHRFVTLSAYWYELPKVKFDLPLANEESVPVEFHASYDDDKMIIQVPTTPVPTREGYEFLGYTMSITQEMPMSASLPNSIDCQPGDVIELGKDIALGSEYTLTANWQEVETPEEVTITLTYDANGGKDAPEAQSAIVTNPEGTALFTVTDQVPTREGYEFVCWSFNKDDSEFAIYAGDQINLGQNMKLYAHWKEIEKPSPETPDIEDPDNPSKPDIENPDKPNKPDTEKPVKPEVKPEVPSKPATKPDVTNKVPQTGDNSNVMLWTLFGIVSLASAAALMQNKKKNRSAK